MRLHRILAALPAALAVGLLAACTASVSGVKQSKDFKYEDIIKGRVAIMGVASIFEELSDKDANRIATNLQISIQDARKNYPLTPMPEVRNTMGKDKYVKVMTEYGTDGILSKPILDELKAALSERFVIAVRIENDQKGEPNWQHMAAMRDSRGVTQKERVDVVVRREVKVTAQVYDLQSAKSVWSGLVTSWGQESKTYPINAPSDLQVLTTLVQAARGDKVASDNRAVAEKYPPPPPPPLYRLLPNAFEAFAKTLPDD